MEIDGAVYKVNSKSEDKRLIGVRSIQYNDEIDELLYENELTCPYCGYKDVDAFELPDEGVVECVKCDSTMSYERIVEVSYSITPVKKAKVTRDL